MYLDLCTWQMDRNGLEVCISKTEKTEKSRFQKLKKSQISLGTNTKIPNIEHLEH